MKQIITFLVILAAVNIVASEFFDDESCTEGNGIIGCSKDCSSQLFCMNGELKNIKCQKTGLFLQTYCNTATNKCETKKNCEQLDGFVCPGRGTYPHLLSCNKLFMCEKKGAAGVLKTCGMIKKYDAGSGTCTGRMCYNFSAKFGLCMGKHDQIVPHPQNSKLFIHCNNNSPTLGSCADGYVLNKDTYKCEFKCPKSGLFIDSSDKNCYFKCTWALFKYNHVRECCDEGEVFNEKLEMCGPDVTRKLQIQ